MRYIKLFFLVSSALLCAGCNLVVLSPQGDIAAQQGELIVYATVLMLLVIVPVIALTVFFAIKYRESNTDAEYEPDWDHSISLELVVWAVPLAIIICLAGLTWVATHRLNPYDPVRRISAETPVDPKVEPMVVQVVALDWKWLFIYPDHGVASVNEFATVVDRPIEFRLTSSTVMNSFYIPALAGQIYTMAGMETELNAVINAEGVFEGFSANYSGAGFSQMRFNMHAYDEDGFNAWIANAKEQAGAQLDQAAFLKLDEPSIKHPVTYYRYADNTLWDQIVNMCVGPGSLCLHDMMAIDALGGGGVAGLFNRELFLSSYQGLCRAASDDPQETLKMLSALRELYAVEASYQPPAHSPASPFLQLPLGAK